MDKFSKKHKKHKKEKKKRIKHSSSESEGEWVELEREQKHSKPLVLENKEVLYEEKKDEKCNIKKRDDWMSVEMDFSSFGHKKESKKEIPRQPPAEKAGQSSRELNPYWRDGGTGLPPEKQKSLERNEKGRFEENRNREVSDDSKKSYRKTEFERYRSDKSEYSSYKRTEKSYETNQNNFRQRDKSYYHRENYKFNKSDEPKPETDRRKSGFNKTFKKPNFDEYDSNNFGRSKKHFEEDRTKELYTDKPKRAWKKEPDVQSSREQLEREENSRKSEYRREDRTSDLSTSYEMSLINQEPKTELSRDELNMLCAKIMKAEMKGNKDEAEKLQVQLDRARNSSKKISTNQQDEKDREVIILTETDSKGFTRPLKSLQEERLNSKRKVETHEGNKRIRYFADDDSQSLSEMFEKERFSSSREQNATFIQLMGKEMSGSNEDAFEETASMERTSRQDRKEWNVAVKEQAQREKALDNCYWCLGSKNMNQDVIVAVRNQVQLCVPSSQSLTDGHCIIIPNDHIPCATNLDEDVWEDIMILRKQLVKIFQAEGDDVIFFECASNLDKHPHMQLHCVPVPKESGDVAPIYFKKAIMECEMEWSNNKKVVDLSGRNVRKAIPRGLPYFAVDFGLQPGYAHVIEDKRLFPNNFAQAIIGGMLDIDHSRWRKLHRDDEENIRKKADYLKQLIQKHL